MPSVYLFDFDDTLIDTNQLFITAINQCLDMLMVTNPTYSRQDIQDIYNRIDKQAFEKFHGDFNSRWPYLVHELSQQLIIDSALSVSLTDTLSHILLGIPTVFPGVVETLTALKQARKKIGLVTQASEEWTQHKLNGTGLNAYIDFALPIGIDSAKTASSWRLAMDHFQVSPEETVVTGDSIHGDVYTAREAGVSTIFWVHNPNGWRLALEGSLPEGVIEITGVDKILNY